MGAHPFASSLGKVAFKQSRLWKYLTLCISRMNFLIVLAVISTPAEKQGSAHVRSQARVSPASQKSGQLSSERNSERGMALPSPFFLILFDQEPQHIWTPVASLHPLLNHIYWLVPSSLNCTESYRQNQPCAMCSLFARRLLSSPLSITVPSALSLNSCMRQIFQHSVPGKTRLP